MYDCFAACAPGLEAALALELQELGLYKVKGLLRASGGIGFAAGRKDLYAADLRLRTADRVLVRLGEFPARAFAELRRKAAGLPWGRFLKPGTPVGLRVASEDSKLYHESAVAERVAGAIADSLGEQPRLSKEEDAQLVDVRLDADLCRISLDSSGASLHRRGYRLAAAKAPLRETLAAGMVLASGWDRRSPLLDPFCGSGTIAIEAALLAAGLAPGRGRRFAFMDWPDFDSSAWQALCAEPVRAEGAPRILASDRDAGAIQAARENAERAGVSGLIEFSCRALSAVEPPGGPGWVVTNPPYGVRLSQGRDLRDLYAQFGRILKLKCPDWSVSVLRGGGGPSSAMGLRLDRSIPMLNGGLPVRLECGKV